MRKLVGLDLLVLLVSLFGLFSQSAEADELPPLACTAVSETPRRFDCAGRDRVTCAGSVQEYDCNCVCVGVCYGIFSPSIPSEIIPRRTCAWDADLEECRNLPREDNYGSLIDALKFSDECKSSCAKQAVFSCKKNRIQFEPIPIPALEPESEPKIAPAPTFPAPTPVNPYSPGNDFNWNFVPPPGFDRCTAAVGAGAVVGYCCYKAVQAAGGFFIAGPGGAVSAPILCP
jgi:hypothetical protein